MGSTDDRSVNGIMEPRGVLRLTGLSERHPGVTEAVAAVYSEAARVCLARHYLPPTEFGLHGVRNERNVMVEWELPDDRLRRAHANVVDATEAGASAVALAAVEEAVGLVAVARAETRSGADYYLAPALRDEDDLESAFRLEISGVDGGPRRVVFERVRQKVEQVLRGRSDLPALVAVVGFGCRMIVVEAVEGFE